MNDINDLGGVSDNQKGISNTTIAVLLILALVITIIGTWAVMNSMTPETPIKHNTNIAQVSLTIHSATPGLSQTTGKAVMELKKAG
jgi:hypothetical protein